MSWNIGAYVKVDGHTVFVMEPVSYTHNTNGMIREAGCPEWSSDGAFPETAGEFTEMLNRVLENLIGDPDTFIAMEPENGWGTYHGLIMALLTLRERLGRFPSATVYASF